MMIEECGDSSQEAHWVDWGLLQSRRKDPPKETPDQTVSGSHKSIFGENVIDCSSKWPSASTSTLLFPPFLTSLVY